MMMLNNLGMFNNQLTLDSKVIDTNRDPLGIHNTQSNHKSPVVVETLSACSPSQNAHWGPRKRRGHTIIRSPYLSKR